MSDISLTTSDFDNGDANSGTALQTLASEVESYINGQNIDRDKLVQNKCTAVLTAYIHSNLNNETITPISIQPDKDFTVTRVEAECGSDGNGTLNIKVQNNGQEVIADASNRIQLTDTTRGETENLQNVTVSEGNTLKMTVQESASSNMGQIKVAIHGTYQLRS